MAERHEVSDDALDQGSPFTRPGFLVAGALVLVIVLLGAIVGVRISRSTTTTVTPPVTTDAPPSATSGASPGGAEASVCGLSGPAAAGPLTTGPAVTWAYQGTIAYPNSPEFGPGKTADEGYRYCFQHSPAGALVMAANALAQGSDQQTGDQWARYVLAQGKYHDQLLSQLGTARGSKGTRVKVAGFRILTYDGRIARIDLGVRGSSQNQDLIVSSVYELVWQNGDWKVSADVERPLDVATIPDLSGYTFWGE